LLLRLQMRRFGMTTNERPTVVGVFPTPAQAESAINELHRFGFTDQQIGYVVRDAGGNTQGNITPDETRTAHRAIGGAVSGGVLGGILGAASSLLIPGFGPAIAGGILVTTLGGAAIGAVTGGLIGALTQMGVPEDEAYYYQQEFEAGRFLVTVSAPGRQQEALDVLRRNGAYDASTQRDSQDVAGNPPYAQVGASPSQAGAYNQPGIYNQPGAYDTNAPGNYNPAGPNAPYNPNDPNIRRQYNPDNPTDPNVGRQYNPDNPTDPDAPNPW
jgi:hypothetical protein